MESGSLSSMPVDPGETDMAMGDVKVEATAVGIAPAGISTGHLFALNTASLWRTCPAGAAGRTLRTL